LAVNPTATQAVGDVHDTPLNRESPPGRVGSIDHREPFQRSASVEYPVLPVTNPTAMHVVADVHDTALNWSWVVPASVMPGFGVGSIDHSKPFQRSANVKSFSAVPK
jgi:hypothetical protein